MMYGLQSSPKVVYYQVAHHGAKHVFFTVMGFFLTSTSTTDLATKNYTFVVISEADVDTSRSETHHSEECDRESDLRILHCDEFLAGIHIRLRNGYRMLQHPSCLDILADSAHIPLLSQGKMCQIYHLHDVCDC